MYTPPQPGWIQQVDMNRGGFWINPQERMPCDGSPNLDANGPGIPGWRCSRKPDYFLTCDKTMPMTCFGAAQVINFPGISNRKYPYLFNSAPVGGFVTGGPIGTVQRAGHGGNGSCPAYDDQVSGVQNAHGQDGKSGLAVIHACKKQCSFVLALQRCATAKSQQWTLHGLWPGGVANCASTRFNLTAISALESELAAHWPSCTGRNHDLWKHEWSKHGSCTGMLQLEYFKQSLQLLTRYSDRCAGTVGDCHLCLTAQLSMPQDI